MSPLLRQLVDWGRQTLLTVGAVLGAVCLLVAAASALFGVRPLVFESGSMSPTIGTGALAISHDVPASDLHVGDIVSVPTGSGQRVTHRIVTVTERGDGATLALRGDANKVPDARTYEVTHADRVLFDVPRLGYVIGWLVGPVGLFLLGLYAAFLLSIVLRREPTSPGAPTPPDDGSPPPPPTRSQVSSRKPLRRRRTDTRSLVRTLSVLAALGLLTASAFPFRAVGTLAAWSDVAPVSGTTLTAFKIPAPDGTHCAIYPGTISSRGVNLTWPTVSAALPAVSYTRAATPASVTTSLTTVGANQQLQVLYDPSSVQNVKVTVTASGYLTTTPLWRSSTTTWTFTTGSKKQEDPTCG